MHSVNSISVKAISVNIANDTFFNSTYPICTCICESKMYLCITKKVKSQK